MSEMFRGADSFNSDLSEWKVGKVEDMTAMFYRAKSFTSNLNKWTIRKNAYTTDMFKIAIFSIQVHSNGILDRL